MRRRIFTLILLAVFLGSFPLSAGETLIPRRIRIIDSNGNLPPMIPDILYAHLASRIPLVISGPGEEPHNTILLESGDRFYITLKDRNEIVDRQDYPLEILNNPVTAAEAFDKIAAEWEPSLGLVQPDVTEELEIRREELEAEISFEEKLNTPFQLTLWMPLAARQSIVTDGDNRKNKWNYLWPLRTDIIWFFTDNLGISGSFRFEYGDHISFTGDINYNALDSTVLMLMPGIGLQVRTIGKISAEFGVSFFMGFVQVTANESSLSPALAAGESTWVLYPVLSLEPAIVWSPTADWSVKARILGLQLGLAGLSGGQEGAGFGTAHNTLILNYFQLGAAYRW